MLIVWRRGQSTQAGLAGDRTAFPSEMRFTNGEEAGAALSEGGVGAAARWAVGGEAGGGRRDSGFPHDGSGGQPVPPSKTNTPGSLDQRCKNAHAFWPCGPTSSAPAQGNNPPEANPDAQRYSAQHHSQEQEIRNNIGLQGTKVHARPPA